MSLFSFLFFSVSLSILFQWSSNWIFEFLSSSFYLILFWVFLCCYFAIVASSVPYLSAFSTILLYFFNLNSNVCCFFFCFLYSLSFLFISIRNWNWFQFVLGPFSHVILLQCKYNAGEHWTWYELFVVNVIVAFQENE